MFRLALAGSAIALSVNAQSIFPSSCPALGNFTVGTCPQYYPIIGRPLDAVHESKDPPTGLAVDLDQNVYLAYPRNGGATPNNVVLCTNFTGEVPWPNAAIQNCAATQDPSTCFINVQNVVLDSIGQMWMVDSGIPPGKLEPVSGGAKIMSFNISTRLLIKTYTIPDKLLYGKLNLNDLRINNTLGTEGFAFMTEIGEGSSLVALNLGTGDVVRRLYNTSVVRPDEKYVGSFNGEAIYAWNGTKKGYLQIGADGIALASGNLYWGVLSSRRFYYIPQAIMANFSLSDNDVQSAIVFPGQLASEQAGFTADNKGRVYLLASEHNSIVYVDTQLATVTEEINGVIPDHNGPVPPDSYVVKTLVQSALIQHADSAAISQDGWLYFCTNQLHYRPQSQYNNVDRRKGPFRSYRTYVGAGPAV